ncbi:CbrC family protein [Tautonia sp. JC769]|uniref:CbrC family protein n=1 Tax=Tautonia sp. JC769 TaxID=3232135 RepID=UPI00345A409F
MPTFSDLGIPFPLFEAPAEEASDYEGIASCRLCGGEGKHCFEAEVLIQPCSSCGAAVGHYFEARRDVPCRACGTTMAFPEALREKKRLLACYDCLRAGKAAIGKDTEFGAVCWEEAAQGVTHGVPGLRTEQFERVPIEPEEDWYGVRIPGEHLWELLRTPRFHSWQGERWLFCCREPMAYLGGWQDALESLRPEDPAAFFDAMFDPDDEARAWGFESFEPGHSSCLYVYRCRTCDRRRATWDCD